MLDINSVTFVPIIAVQEGNNCLGYAFISANTEINNGKEVIKSTFELGPFRIFKEGEEDKFKILPPFYFEDYDQISSFTANEELYGYITKIIIKTYNIILSSGNIDNNFVYLKVKNDNSIKRRPRKVFISSRKCG